MKLDFAECLAKGTNLQVVIPKVPELFGISLNLSFFEPKEAFSFFAVSENCEKWRVFFRKKIFLTMMEIPNSHWAFGMTFIDFNHFFWEVTLDPLALRP